MNTKGIITNLKSIAKSEDDTAVKIDIDEVSKNVIKIDIDVKDVKISTVEKMIKVAKKYKEFKSFEYVAKTQTKKEISEKDSKSKLRLIFKEKSANEGLLTFNQFNNNKL